MAAQSDQSPTSLVFWARVFTGVGCAEQAVSGQRSALSPGLPESPQAGSRSRLHRLEVRKGLGSLRPSEWTWMRAGEPAALWPWPRVAHPGPWAQPSGPPSLCPVTREARSCCGHVLVRPVSPHTLVSAGVSLTPDDSPRTEAGAQGSPFMPHLLGVSPATSPASVSPEKMRKISRLLWLRHCSPSSLKPHSLR